ncbi:MAG TPA: hypothetical protein DD409_03835 [Bacteroidales bacterium]|nr:hypothetical protein [Bacteroidales bacterium]
MPGFVGQIEGPAPQIGVDFFLVGIGDAFQSKLQQKTVITLQLTKLVVGQSKTVLLDEVAEVDKGFPEVGMDQLTDDALV